MDFNYQEQLIYIRIIQEYFNYDFLKVFMKSLVFLESNDYYFFLPLLSFAFVSPKTSMKFLITLFVGFQLMLWTKLFFGQPRPCVFDPTIAIRFSSSNGLPSCGAAMGLFLGAMLTRMTGSYIVGILYCLMMSFSRIYLGMHFFTDLIAGWILGAFLILFFFKIYDRIERKVSSSYKYLSYILLMITSSFVLIVGQLTKMDDKIKISVCLVSTVFLASQALNLNKIKDSSKLGPKLIQAAVLIAAYAFLMLMLDKSAYPFVYVVMGVLAPLSYILRNRAEI